MTFHLPTVQADSLFLWFYNSVFLLSVLVFLSSVVGKTHVDEKGNYWTIKGKTMTLTALRAVKSTK